MVAYPHYDNSTTMKNTPICDQPFYISVTFHNHVINQSFCRGCHKKVKSCQKISFLKLKDMIAILTTSLTMPCIRQSLRSLADLTVLPLITDEAAVSALAVITQPEL